jgi:hypothetical protein
MGVRGDLQLIQMSINHEWDVGHLKPKAISVVENALDSTDDRVRIRALEIVLKMVEQNRKREQLSGIQSDRNRFLEIAQRLGIGQRIERIDGSGTGGSGSIVDGESRAV